VGLKYGFLFAQEENQRRQQFFSAWLTLFFADKILPYRVAIGWLKTYRVRARFQSSINVEESLLRGTS